MAQQGSRSNEDVAAFLNSLGYQSNPNRQNDGFQWLMESGNMDRYADYIRGGSGAAVENELAQGRRTADQVQNWVKQQGFGGEFGGGNAMRYLYDNNKLGDYANYILNASDYQAPEDVGQKWGGLDNQDRQLVGGYFGYSGPYQDGLFAKYLQDNGRIGEYETIVRGFNPQSDEFYTGYNAGLRPDSTQMNHYGLSDDVVRALVKQMGYSGDFGSGRAYEWLAQNNLLGDFDNRVRRAAGVVDTNVPPNPDTPGYQPTPRPTNDLPTGPRIPGQYGQSTSNASAYGYTNPDGSTGRDNYSYKPLIYKPISDRDAEMRRLYPTDAERYGYGPQHDFFPNRTGLTSVAPTEGTRRYAEGGPVVGPGTGTSDSIPALIDGQQPAALSNGEFVFTNKAVRGAGAGNHSQGIRSLNAMMHTLEKKANAHPKRRS